MTEDNKSRMRVVVRIRPPSKKEIENEEELIIEQLDEKVRILRISVLPVSLHTKKYRFISDSDFWSLSRMARYGAIWLGDTVNELITPVWDFLQINE